MTILSPLNRTATTMQSFVLAAFPHGGQGAARRNAWGSMSEDATRARARREAEEAVTRAVAMSAHPASGVR